MEADSINASRFRKRAEKMLSDDTGKVSGDAFSIIKYSAQHLATKRQLAEDEDFLQNLHQKAIYKMKEKEKNNLMAKNTAGNNSYNKAVNAELRDKKSMSTRDDKAAGQQSIIEVAAGGKNMEDDENPKTTAAGITSLLQQSADISAQEVELERQKHTEVLLHISDLVGNLKDTTMLMNKLVVEQNIQLSEIQQAAGQNVEELAQQKKNMEKETKKMTMSFWTTIYTAIWLISMFVATYVVIKIFPKPAYVQAVRSPRTRLTRAPMLRRMNLHACTSSPTEPALKVFEHEWKKASVDVASSVRHEYFPYSSGDNVRGLGCNVGDYKAGAELVTLPLNDCFYTDKGGMFDTKKPPTSRLQACIDEDLWSRLKGTTRLSLLLLDAYIALNGDNGEGGTTRAKPSGLMRGYIDILPREGQLETPIHWSDSSHASAFQALQKAYPFLASRVLAQKESYRTLYGLLRTPSTFSGKAFITSEQQVPFSRLVWAMESVSSRAFEGIGELGGTATKFQLGAIVSAACISLAILLATIPSLQLELPGDLVGDRESFIIGLSTLAGLTLLPAVLDGTEASSKGSSVLLPIIDSCNHRNEDFANCEMAYEVSKEAFVLRARGKPSKKPALPALAEKADTVSDFDARELTVSYGKRDNDDFLQFFGFVECDNPHDCFRFILESEEIKGNGTNNLVTITRGPMEDWDLPEPLVKDKHALRNVLREQLHRVLEARNALDVGGITGKPDRLVRAFLSEKAKVIEAALVRI